MVGVIKDIGKTIMCMVLVVISGLMVECIRGNIKPIKRMDMESILGMMVGVIKGCGRTESRMDMGYIFKVN